MCRFLATLYQQNTFTPTTIATGRKQLHCHLKPLCGGRDVRSAFLTDRNRVQLGNAHDKSYYYDCYIVIFTRAQNISGCNFGSGKLHFLFRSSLVKPHRWLKHEKSFLSMKNTIIYIFIIFIKYECVLLIMIKIIRRTDEDGITRSNWPGLFATRHSAPSNTKFAKHPWQGSTMIIINRFGHSNTLKYKAYRMEFAMVSTAKITTTKKKNKKDPIHISYPLLAVERYFNSSLDTAETVG